jgi:hypothetical protein
LKSHIPIPPWALSRTATRGKKFKRKDKKRKEKKKKRVIFLPSRITLRGGRAAEFF